MDEVENLTPEEQAKIKEMTSKVRPSLESLKNAVPELKKAISEGEQEQPKNFGKKYTIDVKGRRVIISLYAKTPQGAIAAYKSMQKEIKETGGFSLTVNGQVAQMKTVIKKD